MRTFTLADGRTDELLRENVFGDSEADMSTDLWRNGSASDSRSEGCVFDSRQVQSLGTDVLLFIFIIV